MWFFCTSLYTGVCVCTLIYFVWSDLISVFDILRILRIIYLFTMVEFYSRWVSIFSIFVFYYGLSSPWRISVFLAPILTYFPTHIRLYPIFTNLPTYPNMGYPLWTTLWSFIHIYVGWGYNQDWGLNGGDMVFYPFLWNSMLTRAKD